MNNTHSELAGASRRSHITGLGLLLLSTVLAVVVVLVLKDWSSDPGAQGKLVAGLLGSQDLRVDSSSHAAGTPSAGLPRTRSGLVPTSSNRGQVLFGRYCDSCHTGAREMIGPSLLSAQFKSQYKNADKIIQFVRTGGFDMPAYPPALLSDEELQAITEYILSLPEESP